MKKKFHSQENAGKYHTDLNNTPIKSEMMKNYMERHRAQDYGKLMTKVD